MKNRKPECVDVSETVYVRGEKGGEHEIEFEVMCAVENDGIGPYEFWGAPGFDEGSDYLVMSNDPRCFMVQYHKGKQVKRQIKANKRIIDAIEKFITDNNNEILNYAEEEDDHHYEE